MEIVELLCRWRTTNITNWKYNIQPTIESTAQYVNLGEQKNYQYEDNYVRKAVIVVKNNSKQNIKINGIRLGQLKVYR